jgi:hypothetical protein
MNRLLQFQPYGLDPNKVNPQQKSGLRPPLPVDNLWKSPELTRNLSAYNRLKRLPHGRLEWLMGHYIPYLKDLNRWCLIRLNCQLRFFLTDKSNSNSISFYSDF